ncbi:MAG: isopentenyl-diphosphate Delta-isomerase [Bacteroidetes bacterium]|nr:isopentenyl-diphosphate Delta-isomerase [Bacteroidota bacterium]
MDELLILVDDKDKPWGKLEKNQVHQLGLLHRAFSVFIFNSKGELLLQQRADNKYHSPGLWTNTCCSHPRFGEELKEAIDRRLREEMGLVCETEFAFSFVYKAEFENGLIEHEFDHVYMGQSNNRPAPNLTEVKNWKYIRLSELENELTTSPEKYSAWLKICFSKLRDHSIKKFTVEAEL